jgi:hypothetical protein
VVTGKGGTGKTTVAAALAMALASGGGRTLLVEVEDRQGIARLFDCSPLPYADRKVAIAPDGGDVFALAVEAKAALLEYLEMFYRLGRAGKALEKIGAVDFATTIAPGLRDVLLTGKVYEAVRRRERGRIGRFLNVNEEVAGLAKVGPIRNQANGIMSMLRSPRTVVHLVTVLEEMPVQETGDAVAELRAIGLPVGAIVVNMVREPVLGARQLAAAGKGRLDSDEVRAGLVTAGRPPVPRPPLTRWWTDCWPRPASTANGWPWNAASERFWPTSSAPPTSCRGSPAVSSSATCTTSPAACSSRGWREPAEARPGSRHRSLARAVPSAGCGRGPR